MLPNFLVIGAQRSGTSWLAQNLRRHPQVFLPKVKEIHFFDRHYEKGMEWYESHFDGRKDEPAVGEATPAYLHGAYSKRDIPALIRQHLPDAKLIACLRNPVDRAYSNYLQNLANFDENRGLSFEEKLAATPEILQIGEYATQLERYYAHFPREQIHLVLYDDVEREPLAVLRSIYSFLGIDPAFTSGVESVRRNAAVGKRNLARSKTLWYVERVLAKAGLVAASERLRTSNVKPQPRIDAGTRARLKEHYRPKNAQLSTLLGRDFSHWDE